MEIPSRDGWAFPCWNFQDFLDALTFAHRSRCAFAILALACLDSFLRPPVLPEPPANNRSTCCRRVISLRTSFNKAFVSIRGTPARFYRR